MVEAVKWYRKAAEQNMPEAQFNLGGCYKRGEGVATNFIIAVEWYRKSAEQNLASAQFNLGLCCVRGQGTKQDDVVRWTPSFRPLSAENKMDSPSLLSSLFLFVCRSRCALNPFGKERTSRAGHRPSSLSLLMGFQYLPPQAV